MKLVHTQNEQPEEAAPSATPLLDQVIEPSDMKGFDDGQLRQLADDVRTATIDAVSKTCLLYTSPSPRDQRGSRMPSSA